MSTIVSAVVSAAVVDFVVVVPNVIAVAPAFGALVPATVVLLLVL